MGGNKALQPFSQCVHTAACNRIITTFNISCKTQRNVKQFILPRQFTDLSKSLIQHLLLQPIYSCLLVTM